MRAKISACLVLVFHWQSCLAKLPAITEQKSYNFVFKYGAVIGQYPDVTREAGDILVNYGYPLDNLRYFLQVPGKYPYLPDFATNKGATTVSQLGPKIADNIPSGQNCKTLLSPGTVWYREYDMSYTDFIPYYNPRKHRDIPIRPSSFSPIPLTKIRDCCDPDSCKEKIFELPAQEAVILVFNEGLDDLLFAGKCTLCLIQAGKRSCRNGEYATDYSYLDRVSR